MKEVRISLPDDLARNAERAGLLAPEAMQALLRDKLREDAIENLRQAWSRMGDEEPSPEDEALIAEAIRWARKGGNAS